jgi:hypothetical protein
VVVRSQVESNERQVRGGKIESLGILIRDIKCQLSLHVDLSYLVCKTFCRSSVPSTSISRKEKNFEFPLA